MFILAGCASQTQRATLDTQFEPDSLFAEIRIEEFLSLKNVNLGKPLYIGFGDFLYSKVKSSRGKVVVFDVEFQKIFFNKQDRELYVEGRLVRLLSEDQFEKCQIFIGRELISFPDTADNEFGTIKYSKIDYNYFIPRSGNFIAKFPIFNYSIMFFTTRELYNDIGEYVYTPMSTVLAFDVYKLLNKTR